MTEGEGTGRPEQKPWSGGDTAATPTTVGTGWTTVVVARTPAELTGVQRPDNAQAQPGASPLAAADLLDGLFPKVSGDWGSGRLLTTKLVNVLLTDDGRVLAGAVTPERLYEVAKGQR